jgi:hypothetical protein
MNNESNTTLCNEKDTAFARQPSLESRHIKTKNIDILILSYLLIITYIIQSYLELFEEITNSKKTVHDIYHLNYDVTRKEKKERN